MAETKLTDESEDEPSSIGDALLVLDSGLEIPVHSVYIANCSQVLADAVGLADEASAPGAKLRMPLPSTPDAEAQQLISILHKWRPETFLCSLDLAQLLAAAR